tara:strand:+ start:1665 stop:2309 length:645 start_codon:yes stop_codon:yes gene_type:complete
MSRSLYLLILCVFSVFILGQNTIDNIYIEPANPTSLDSIKVYADLTFHSSGCGLDNKYFSIAGNAISASTHHCLGMAMAICSTKDTFMIGPLPDGAYTFDLSLTSGFGNIPCTPGIAVDDIKTYDFNVGNVVALNQDKKVVDFYYSNRGDVINILLPQRALYRLSLYELNGKCLKRFEVVNDYFMLNVSEIVSGIYIMQVSSVNLNYTSRLFIN